jgi:hypothetical protein
MGLSLARAAEFPVYYESSNQVKNFVTMTTLTKEWHFDAKTWRVERKTTIGSKVITAINIVKNGTMYMIDDQKKTIRVRPYPNAVPTTGVHEFTDDALTRSGMHLAGSETIEGQDCEKWMGNPVKSVVQNDPKAKAQIGQIDQQMKKTGQTAGNALNTSATTFWIRKSDRRMIRTGMTMGGSESGITYHNISTDPALFKQSLLDLPTGYLGSPR